MNDSYIKDYAIVIPSYRRMPRLSTLNNLPESVMNYTYLVVDDHDSSLRNLYDTRGCKIIPHGPEIKTIAQKRAWIIRNCDIFGRKIIMLDDDLRFAIRPIPDKTQLVPADSESLLNHIKELLDKLDKYIHAGWSMRQGNNNCKSGGWVENTRMCYTLAYDAVKIRSLEIEEKIQLGRIETREDMDLTLQLLKIGFRNAVNFNITADQVGGFAAKGGCSEPGQRTIETSDRDACKLAEFHPGLVKVVDRVYEGSVNRKEVIVQWKKAFEILKED